LTTCCAFSNGISSCQAARHWWYIDTRTRRWRSEIALKQPSGLLDWEALSELQQELLDHPSAIIVSPAPIFGVKLIETIQRVFSWCGLCAAGGRGKLDGPSRHGAGDPEHFPTLTYSWQLRDSVRRCALLLRVRSVDPTPQGRATHLADHQQRHQERISQSLARMVRPSQPLAVLTALSTELADQTPPHAHRSVYVPEHAEAGERLWNSAGIGQVYFNAAGPADGDLSAQREGGREHGCWRRIWRIIRTSHSFFLHREPGCRQRGGFSLPETVDKDYNLLRNVSRVLK
jgi:hypothetical protein